MIPEQEKKLQRVLQILTLIVFLFAIGLAIASFGYKPFASIFNATNDAKVKRTPQAIEKTADSRKKVKRAQISGIKTEDIKTASEMQTPQSPEFLGDLAFSNKDFKKAEAQYELAITLNDTASLRVKLLRSLLAQRKILEAKTFLDERLDDKNAGFQLYRGVLAALLNQADESQKNLKELAEKQSPDEFEMFFIEKAKTVLKAFEEWKFAVDSKIEYLQTLLAKAFDEIGEYELAVAMALDAIKSKDDYRDAWIVLGHAYLASNKLLDAESAFEKALKLDAGHPEAYFYMAFAKRGLKKWEQALLDLQKSAELGMPKNTFFEETEAELLYELGKYKEALSIYKKVLAEKGMQAKPHEYIRPLYLLLDVFQQKKDGLKLAETAVNFYPNEAQSYNLLGWAYLSSGNFDKALSNLNQALKLDSNMPAVYFNLGKLAEYEDKSENAKINYEKAIELAAEQGDQSIGNAAKNRLSKLLETLQLNQQ